MSKYSITHRERINGLLAGNKIDKVPITFWRHFPLDDQSPKRLANATSQFQNTFDFDIIKVSPSSSFCIRDWGVQDFWEGNTEGTRKYTNAINLDGLGALEIQNASSGSLGNQLLALSIIADNHLASTPIVQTIFSPLSQLKNILGKENLLSAIRQSPKIIHIALEIITETTRRFMLACKDIQIDGFFFAVQHASADVMSINEFLVFGKAYDEQLFSSIEALPINILHIHGSNIYFAEMLDYPCQIFNWHDRDTAPTLAEASLIIKKVFCGGLSRIRTMVRGDAIDIENEINDAIEQSNNKNLIIGTGCVLPIITPFGNIKHAVNYTRLK